MAREKLVCFSMAIQLLGLLPDRQFCWRFVGNRKRYLFRNFFGRDGLFDLQAILIFCLFSKDIKGFNEFFQTMDQTPK